jgi:hypothetical protein
MLDRLVSWSIDLDDQPPLEADKVLDAIANRHLSAKFHFFASTTLSARHRIASARTAFARCLPAKL